MAGPLALGEVEVGPDGLSGIVACPTGAEVGRFTKAIDNLEVAVGA